jgi:hypothetical protein
MSNIHVFDDEDVLDLLCQVIIFKITVVLEKYNKAVVVDERLQLCRRLNV